MLNKLRKLYYKRGTQRWRKAYWNAILTGNKQKMIFFRELNKESI